MILVGLLVGCANPPPSPPLLEANELFVVGRYRYEDGDRISWRCASDIQCDDALIRDGTLQHVIERRRFHEFRVVLVARRVDACGPDGSEFTCAIGAGPTVLRVVRWIEPTA